MISIDTALAMEVIGWSGSVLVVIAYALISAGKINGTSLGYQLLNLVGSSLLIAFTVYKQAYPPATVNSIWAVIAVIGIVNVWRARNKKVES